MGVSSTMMFMKLSTLALDLRSSRTEVCLCTTLPSGSTSTSTCCSEDMTCVLSSTLTTILPCSTLGATGRCTSRSSPPCTHTRWWWSPPDVRGA